MKKGQIAADPIANIILWVIFLVIAIGGVYFLLKRLGAF